MERPFLGAHVALFLGSHLLVILRDNDPTIPSPNCWDFPGGTAEAGETPMKALQREVMEEVTLDLPESAITYRAYYPSVSQPGYWNWFFVAHMPASEVDNVTLGEEGQKWDLMTIDQFLALEEVVQPFPQRLRDWLDWIKR